MAFYFKDGTCGKIMLSQFEEYGPFTIEDVKASFEQFTGISSGACQVTNNIDLKSVVSLENKRVALTIDPITLWVEDFTFFAHDATAYWHSGD